MPNKNALAKEANYAKINDRGIFRETKWITFERM